MQGMVATGWVAQDGSEYEALAFSADMHLVFFGRSGLASSGG